EQVRLGLDGTKPMAVQQWQGLIAVNYPARRYGLSKYSSVQEARKHCPNIQLVHVATYANNSASYAYHSHPSRRTHKVSLEPYRRASVRILHVLESFTKSIEKASIADEAFIDVTDMVLERTATKVWPANTHILPGDADQEEALAATSTTKEQPADATTQGALDTNCNNWPDFFLNIAAEISAEIRHAVFDQLGYTCSTGIAHNKTLAKLGSGLNKPNQQTVVRECAVARLLRDYPVRKIRNLGGKLGHELVTAFGVEKAGEVWKYSLEELTRKLKSPLDAQLVYNVVRGLDDSEIKPRQLCKSMAAAKSVYPPLTQMAEVERWLDVLAVEIFSRVQDHYAEHRRWPQSLSVSAQ
ncbi:hypothetical protein THASP1DRAFT_14138, partial [Thamnocephalis sphaerospora]